VNDLLNFVFTSRAVLVDGYGDNVDVLELHGCDGTVACAREQREGDHRAVARSWSDAAGIAAMTCFTCSSVGNQACRENASASATRRHQQTSDPGPLSAQQERVEYFPKKAVIRSALMDEPTPVTHE
jgi:hypothetical protein